MATETALEILNDAHVAFLFDDSARNSSRLFDACLGAGMGHDVPDHEAWAAVRIARWLTSGCMAEAV